MEPYQHLEREIAQWMGYRPEQVVACSSGTAALHLAWEAFRQPRFSRVIVPDYAMIACARSVSLADLTPYFVDCTRDLLLDPELVAKAAQRSRSLPLVGILAVHTYGRVCNVVALHRCARDYDLIVVEDMAEAHGVRPHIDTDAACWSFYKNKIVHGEEGGAIAFKSPVAADIARSLRSLGFTPAHDFTHIPRGHNYRMSNLHAQPIRESLGHFPMLIEWRREIEGWYEQSCPAEWHQPDRSVPWVYDIRLSGLTSLEQDAIVSTLRGNGIEARHGFKSLSQQEEYRESGCLRGKCEECNGTGDVESFEKYPEGITVDCPVCNGTTLRAESHRAGAEVIYLPIQPGITDKRSVQLSFSLIQLD